MCYQRFEECRCRHIKIIETPCDLATGFPLYIKAACPNYEFESVKTTQLCGSAGFYCRRQLEGEFFEDVHSSLIASARFAESRLRAQAIAILKCAFVYERQRAKHWPLAKPGLFPPFHLPPHVEAGMVPELRKHLHALEARRRDQLFEPDYFTLDHVQQPTAEAPLTLEHVQQPTVEASYTPGTCTPQVNIMPPTPVKFDTMSPSTTSTPMMKEVVLQGLQSSKKQRKRRLSNISDGADVQSLTATPPSLKESRRKPALPKQTSELRRSTRARAKVVNYAESASSEASTEDAYPERSNADSFSPSKSNPTASPARPENPPRRKGIAHRGRDTAPARPGLLRSSSSLGRLIEDWKSRTTFSPATPPQGIRSGILHFPSGQTVGRNYSASHGPRQQLKTFTPNQTNTTPFWQSEPMHNNSRVCAESGDIWLDSRYRHTYPSGTSQFNGLQTLPSLSSTNPYESDQWRQPRPPNLYNAYASESMNFAPGSNYLQQPTNGSQRGIDPGQDWLINTPAFQSTASPPPPPARDHLSRNLAPLRDEPFDSTTATLSMRPQAMQAYQQHLNHSRTRHDFGTPPNLDVTPPEPFPTSISDPFDPQKRRAPASSPLPAAKRVRPSFPGEDLDAVDVASHAQHWDSDSAIIMPSPSKVPNQVDVSRWSRSQYLSGGDEQQTSPPWIPTAGFAPTAVMKAPSLERRTSSELDF